MLCVGEFGAGLGELVCDVCGRVLCRFVGVNLCCVWDTLWRVWRSYFVLCVGEFDVGLGE